MNTINVENCKTLLIGRRGENEVTTVAFDFTEWQTEFGSGVVDLYVKRFGDNSAYPVVLTIDGTVASWLVTETDTNVAGYGKAEYVYRVDGKIAKSAVFPFFVGEDIGQPASEPPDPYESWLEQLTALGAETEAHAQAAEQSAENAAESAEDAAQSAASAESYAGQAETAAGLAQAAQTASEAARDAAQTAQASAEASATAASGSAASAAGSATAAAGSASDASSSASAAGASATAASASATTASTAATAAQTAQSAAEDAAEDAQQAAQQAHVEYEQLSGEVDNLSDEVAQQKSAIENVEASLATVETTSTASRAYAVGDLLVYNNRLYRVASVIASGATLTPGTNITLTTVESELAEISEAIPTDPISPGMALTRRTYIQNGDFAWSTLSVSIKNGTITLSTTGATAYRTIWLSGQFGGSSSTLASAIPAPENCLDISFLRGCNAVKLWSSVDLTGVQFGIKFVSIENDTVTVIEFKSFGFIDGSLSRKNFEIPSGATHFALFFYKGSGATLGTSQVSFEFDVMEV